MAQQDDSLIREVDEEMRRERIEKIWQRYSTLIIAGALLVIGSVGAFQYWQHSQAQARADGGVRYQQAVKLIGEGKTADGEAALKKLGEDGTTGYRALAQLRLAGQAASAGKTADAVKAYDAIAADAALDPLLRDLARVQAATLRVDSADFTEMQNRLNDLAKGTGPWRFAARETLAMAAIKAGKTEDARKTLEQLVTERKAPSGVVQRATLLLQLMAEGGPGLLEKGEKPAEKAPAKEPEKASTKAPEKAPAEAGKTGDKGQPVKQ